MNIKNTIITVHKKLLSEESKEKAEQFILSIAIIGFIVHLIIILLNNQGIIHLNENFFTNPIAAVYTPFSFILVYEVYLLVFFLPKSITIYIGKQYEIITLIVIRRIFKDIAYLELTPDWFQNPSDLQFTIDVLTALVLFFIIYLFYQKNDRQIYKSIDQQHHQLSDKIKRFVQLKQTLATILVPLLIILAFITLFNWISATINNYHEGLIAFKKINNIFFDEFFTVLIIVDVLLLLFSFFYSGKFHKIIRNSGFIISTILIKISFSTEGLLNNALVVGAVLFGYLILIIHNLYEKNELAIKQKE